MLDSRELGRRAGSQREVTRTVPAPAGLGIDILSIPEGSPVTLDLRLEAVLEGVLVTGEVQAALEGECARCLDPITDEFGVTFQELFLYDDQQHGAGGQDDVDDDDDEVRMMEDDLLDLEPLLRDAVVLALPFQPLCQDDCPGLCTECGASFKQDPDHTHEAPIDPRWSALASVETEQDPK